MAAATFSDFKSRGFGLMQSQIERPERLERLILIMALAMYWAVSAGVFREAQDAIREQKNAAKAAEILCSLFKQGLRFLPRCLTGLANLPRLWQVWIN